MPTPLTQVTFTVRYEVQPDGSRRVIFGSDTNGVLEIFDGKQEGDALKRAMEMLDLFTPRLCR